MSTRSLSVYAVYLAARKSSLIPHIAELKTGKVVAQIWVYVLHMRCHCLKTLEDSVLPSACHLLLFL